MSRCINCGKSNASVPHNDGGYVCRECIGGYFSCPDCGSVFDQDTGDAGNGFCTECAPEH